MRNDFRLRRFFLAAYCLPLVPLHLHAITAEQAKTAIEAFNNVYWRQSNKTFYKFDNKTGELDYWMWAHAWETEMDAYERTRDPFYLQKIRDTYDGFTAKHGTKMSNQYNDDQGWWVMAATRAYDLTGVADYRNFAKTNFDWMLSTQTDNVAGGGIWWKNNEHKQKNSASTLPFSIAGFKLARQLSDAGYADKAKSLHLWNKTRLWRPTGEVGDRIEINGTAQTTVWGPLSYNHGTFIASSWEMFKATRDSVYFRDALATTTYFRDVKCDPNTGIFPDEKGDGTGNTNNDAGMYKTVFVHYAMQFIKEARQWQYLPWMNRNAESLWNNRRKTDNLMHFLWGTPAPTASGSIGSQMATGGVAMLNLMVVADGMQRYIEATDTTNAQGQGLGNAFTANGTGISANGNRMAMYQFRQEAVQGGFRLYSHSFQDIKKAPADFTAISADRYNGADILNRAFVLRMKDSTYAKVAIQSRLPDSRYVYRYGVSGLRNNTVLVEGDYAKGTRYKVNNFQIQPSAPAQTPSANNVSNFKWESPLDNDGRLTGYELYAIDVAKADTAKPVNLADWTLLSATAQTAFSWVRVGDDKDKYLNIVAVYETGKSAPLDGWASIPNPNRTPSALAAPPDRQASPPSAERAFGYPLPGKGGSPSRWFDLSGRFLPVTE